MDPHQSFTVGCCRPSEMLKQLQHNTPKKWLFKGKDGVLKKLNVQVEPRVLVLSSEHRKSMVQSAPGRQVLLPQSDSNIFLLYRFQLPCGLNRDDTSMLMCRRF